MVMVSTFPSCLGLLALVASTSMMLTAGMPFMRSFKTWRSSRFTCSRAFPYRPQLAGSSLLYREFLHMSSSPKNDIIDQLDSSRGRAALNANQENQMLRTNEPSIVIKVFNEVLNGENSNGKLDIFRQELNSLRGRDLAEAMFLAAKIWKRDRKVDIVKDNLKEIAARMEMFPTDGWRAKDITFMIFSMQSIRTENIGAIEFLKIITKIMTDSFEVKIEKNENKNENKNKNQSKSKSKLSQGPGSTSKIPDKGQVLSSRQIAMIFYGLQGFQSNNLELRKLLSCLKVRMTEMEGEFDTISIGQSLLGMQRMDSKHVEVRNVLSVLTEKILQSSFPLDSQAVGNALFGLQKMSSDHVEVQKLLSVLVPKIKNCTYVFTAQELSNSLQGLRGMKNDNPEVRTLVRALTVHIIGCRERLTGVGASSILHSLQGLVSGSGSVNDSGSGRGSYSGSYGDSGSVSSGSDSEEIKHENEVDSLLEALHSKIMKCSDITSAVSLSNAIYGLQGMSSSNPYTLLIISHLTANLKKSNDVFSGKDIGTALYGLKSMSSHKIEVRTLLSVLTKKILECKAHPKSLTEKMRKFGTFQKVDLPHIRSTDISNALCGLQGMFSEHIEVRNILQALSPLLKNCVDTISMIEFRNAMIGLQNMRSDSREVRTILLDLLPKIREIIEMNIYEEIKSEDLGLCLFSLQNMSDDCIEVRDIISCLLLLIENSSDDFSSSSISNSLYGLQQMSGRETLDLFLVLVPKIQRCTSTFTAKDVSNSLYGFKDMSSTCLEVRTVLMVLVLKIKSCSENFTPHEASRALYGLQGMSSEYIEVRTVLFALVPIIKSCVGRFNAFQIGISFYGLQGLLGKIEALSITEYLYGQVELLYGGRDVDNTNMVNNMVNNGGNDLNNIENNGGGDDILGVRKNVVSNEIDNSNNNNDDIRKDNGDKKKDYETGITEINTKYDNMNSSDIILLLKYLTVIKIKLKISQEKEYLKWTLLCDNFESELNRRKKIDRINRQIKINLENKNILSPTGENLFPNFIENSNENIENLSINIGQTTGTINQQNILNLEKTKFLSSFKETFRGNKNVKMFTDKMIFDIFSADFIISVRVPLGKMEVELELDLESEQGGIDEIKLYQKQQREQQEDQSKQGQDMDTGPFSASFSTSTSSSSSSPVSVLNTSPRYSSFNINVQLTYNDDYSPENKLRYSVLRDEYLRSRGTYTVRLDAADLRNVRGKELSSWFLRMISHYTRKYKETRIRTSVRTDARADVHTDALEDTSPLVLE